MSGQISASSYTQMAPNIPSTTPAATNGVSSSTGSPAATSQSGTGITVGGNNRENGNNANNSSHHSPIHHHHPHVYPSMYKDTTFTKIFVGGLPYHTTDKTLKDYFEVFGDIEEAVVITDRQTAKSRGYGFVTMLDRSAAERACKEPNPIIDGRKANVNLAYLGAKPRTNGIAALHARAAAASYAPFLQSPMGYPSPYLYPSPILISPNLFLPNTHSTSPNNAGGQNSPALGGASTTSPPPSGNGQSYYDFSTAAALAAAASSFVQQHQYPSMSAQYASAFADPTTLYSFAPYAAAAAQAGLLQNGNYSAGLLHMNHQGGSGAGSSASSSSNGYVNSSNMALRGEK